MLDEVRHVRHAEPSPGCHQHDAKTSAGEKQLEPAGAVGEPDDEPIPGPEPQPGELVGGLVRSFVYLCECDPVPVDVVEIEDASGVALERPLEDRVNGGGGGGAVKQSGAGGSRVGHGHDRRSGGGAVEGSTPML